MRYKNNWENSVIEKKLPSQKCDIEEFEKILYVENY